MLDIIEFRVEKGGNPEKIRESQRRRFADVGIVDEVIELDKAWRQRQFELDGLRTDRNKLSKEIARLKIAKEDASGMVSSTEENKKLTAEKEADVKEALAALHSKLFIIGNLVHDSVPVDNNEDNNAIIRSWGEKRTEPNMKNHVELVELLGIADLKKGANVAGGRGYYLTGWSFTAMQTRFFMRKDIMGKCAQLAQFDEELYKVSGDGDDKYLIATAEQPLFVSIVSGALNDAAAKKYDLEGWFPASKTFRELVSCSNCTDYQSRRLETRYGQKKSNDKAKEYVHLLNSTLTATERTICAILENNQKDDRVEIPEVLRGEREEDQGMRYGW
ncbi:hypothetical protein CASFOL_032124 [Castilleja foliolosa]|uniref:Seryl-tRNA synthetase n=1 Tax=Castilleja foliolosa TaxID=1961234 RepID=A0ABD3C0J7_9LAMI